MTAFFIRSLPLLSSFFFFSLFTHFFCCISFGFVLYIWWPLNSFIPLCIFSLFFYLSFSLSLFLRCVYPTFVYNGIVVVPFWEQGVWSRK